MYSDDYAGKGLTGDLIEGEFSVTLLFIGVGKMHLILIIKIVYKMDAT